MAKGEVLSLRASKAPTKAADISSELQFALVHDWMAVAGGAEATFHEICNLYDGPIYTSQCKFEAFPWLKDRDVHTSFVQNLPFALRKHYLYAPAMPKIFRGFDLSDADVVLVDSHSFAHHASPRPDAIYIAYYHTTARSLWTPEIDDRAHRGKMGWARRRLMPSLKALDFSASRRPDYVIANSKNTAERIRHHYHREADEIIYPPVDTQKWADVRREDCNEGLLIWGRLVGYKRIDIAIEAARLTGHKLNIVGAGPMEPALKEQARGMKNVKFHGRLDDDELKKLMSCCWGVIFPGYEDFGLVPVEAMASGLPVIAYGIGGAAETVGNAGGVLVQEQSPQAFANAINELGEMEFDHRELRKLASIYDIGVFRERYKSAVTTAIELNRGK